LDRGAAVWSSKGVATITLTHGGNFAVCLDYLGHSHGAKWRSIKCNIHNGLTHASADATGFGVLGAPGLGGWIYDGNFQLGRKRKMRCATFGQLSAI